MKQVRELMSAGNLNDALLKLDDLVAQFPKDTEIALHRGFALHELNRFDEALPDLQRVQKTFGDDSGLWELLGDTLLQVKRYSEALKPLNRAMELDPKRLTARYLRGVCFQSLARYREALADCDKYIAGSQYDKKGYLLKALIHEGLKEQETALAASNVGLFLDPLDADLLALRARLLFQAGRPEAALEVIDAATIEGRGSSSLESLRLDLLLLLDRFEEALPLLDECIRQNPDRAVHLRRARVHDWMGDPASAEADRQTAAQLTLERLEDIYRAGMTRTVVLIQAGLELFAVGNDDGCVLVLLTFDETLNADLDRMQRIAKVLGELKDKVMSNNAVLRLADSAIGSESPVPYRRQPIPLDLTEGITCYAADLNIYRDFLPERRLTEKIHVLSVVAEPGDSGRMEMLPIAGEPA